MTATCDIQAPSNVCCHCRSSIGIVPPRATEGVEAWICKACGSVCFGTPRKHAGIVALEQTGPIDSFFAVPVIQRGLEQPYETSPHIHYVVDTLVANSPYLDDRREHARYPIAAPVTAVPLSSDYRIAGPPLSMTTMNVSLGGAALIHRDPCDAPFLSLDFTPAGLELVQILLRVLRHSQMGAYHVEAGEFLRSLSSASN